MTDRRFVSAHLSATRRDLFRASRHYAFRACGTGTSMIAVLAPTTPAAGAILMPGNTLATTNPTGDLCEENCRRYEIKIGFTTIGRSWTNDVVIPREKEYVSRRHCALLAHRGGWIELFDLASLNHTYLNGERVTNYATLRSGDVVTLGDFSFKVLLYRGRCPTCRNTLNWEGNPVMPFCSDRCRLINFAGRAGREDD